MDKIDRHFQVNWLGQFYVCNLLWPLLRKTSQLPETPAPRIVWESSEVHRSAPSATRFETPAEINNPGITHTGLYARTKLAIILGVKYGLVDRVIKQNNDNIYALSVHPGTVSCQIGIYLSALSLMSMPGQHVHAAAMERRLSRGPGKADNNSNADGGPGR